MCAKTAVIYHSDSGKSFCKHCYIQVIEGKVHKNITRNQVFRRTDKIVLGFSGGKDSLTILDILNKRQKRIHGAPPIIALTIDEGVEGYRAETLKIAKQYCESEGIVHIIISFKDVFGHTLDEIVKAGAERGLETHACTFCGVLRRKILNDFSLQVGATQLVTGHNLDDHIQTFLLNLLRGDTNRIFKWNAFLTGGREPFVSKIQPLYNITAKDIVLYLYFKELPMQEIPCPYSRSQPILRWKVQNFINSLSQSSPEMKYNLMYSLEEIQKLASGAKPQPKIINYCQNCAGPTNPPRTQCKACELFEKLGFNPIDKAYGTLFEKFKTLWESGQTPNGLP